MGKTIKEMSNDDVYEHFEEILYADNITSVYKGNDNALGCQISWSQISLEALGLS